MTCTTPLRRRPATPRPAERGATTAEYAVGTLGAVAIAGVLVRLGTDGWFADELREIITSALRPGVLIDLVRGGVTWAPLW